MSTFSELRSRIETELNRGTSIDSVVNAAIASAVVFYEGRRFAFNTARATTGTVAGIEYYKLPSDFIEVDFMRSEESSDYLPMYEVPYDWIDEHRRSPEYQSRPRKFAIQNAELRVWPVPDTSYTLRMSYMKSYPALSASASDATTDDIIKAGEELIRTHAKIDVLENYIQGQDSFDKAARLRLRETEIYKELKRIANRQQSSGMTVPVGPGALK